MLGQKAVSYTHLKNRCPSGFQTAVEQKFKVSGGIYIEVSNDYRAS